MLHNRAYAGAHLPRLGLESVGGELLMSVLRGQCDAIPTVTFPAARHHRPLATTKLYCLVTEAQCVLTTCTRQWGGAGIRTRKSGTIPLHTTGPHNAQRRRINVQRQTQNVEPRNSWRPCSSKRHQHCPKSDRALTHPHANRRGISK